MTAPRVPWSLWCILCGQGFDTAPTYLGHPCCEDDRPTAIAVDAQDVEIGDFIVGHHNRVATAVLRDIGNGLRWCYRDAFGFPITDAAIGGRVYVTHHNDDCPPQGIPRPVVTA